MPLGANGFLLPQASRLLYFKHRVPPWLLVPWVQRLGKPQEQAPGLFSVQSLQKHVKGELSTWYQGGQTESPFPRTGGGVREDLPT